MSRTAPLPLLLLLSGALAAAPAHAGGDAQRGAGKAGTCVACHGEGGAAPQGNFPVLAGQHAKYLAHTIRGYRSGSRPDPVMLPIASQLSDEDIEDLAAYFASQPGPLE